MGQIVHLSLGSNLGDRIKNLHQALELINNTSGTITKVSHFYETEPWGFQTDQQFLNICATLETEHTPEILLHKLQSIEKKMGRKRSKQSGYISRTIDLDILTFEEMVIESDHLTVPHPEFINRNFVLIPLQEIAPNFTHPKTAKTIQQIIADCIDETSVVVYESK